MVVQNPSVEDGEASFECSAGFAGCFSISDFLQASSFRAVPGPFFASIQEGAVISVAGEKG